MKACYLFLIYVLVACSAQTQQLSANSHDFGEVHKTDKRYVDITYTNTTGKQIYLLSIKNKREVKVLTSGQKLLPDSSLTIRLKYNPTEKGKFNIKTPIYFSHMQTPLVFTMKGDIKEYDNGDLDCPSFGKKDIFKEQSFESKVLVLDKNTRKPISNANVRFVFNGRPYKQLKTNRKGIIKTQLPIGLYYLVTSADSYLSNEFAKYLNKRENEVIVYLDQEQVVVEETELEEVFEKPVTVLEPPKIEPEEIKEIEEQIEGDIPLPKSKYKPNNIVFLLDISSSMRASGKLDLLKAAMIEMTEILRDVDKITIVAYSTFSKVLMKTTTGNETEKIVKTIEDLRANGMTAGGEGMKMAYREAEKNFIAGANNQVIMATDGDFNRGTTKIDKTVSKYLKKGITISVLGIKNKEKHAKDMQEISQLGNGHYLYIDGYETSRRILINEIRQNSKR